MKQLLWAILAITTGAYIVGPVVDPDLWWHIVIGRWIINHYTVPTVDYWTVFGAGTDWRAYSWAVEVVFALTERFWGANGLLALQWAFGAGLAAAFFYVFGRISRSYTFGALLGIYCTAATFNHFTLRPQVLVWIYFALLVYVAEEILERGWTTKRAVLITLIMAAWANTHLSAILGIGAIIGWLLESKDYKLVLKAALAAFLGTLITPYLGGEWLMMFDTASHPLAFSSIREFAPATIGQYSTGFVLLLGLVVASFFHHDPKRFSPVRWVLIGGFLIVGLWIVKFLPFAAVLLTAQLAVYWKHRSPGSRNGISEGLNRLVLLVQSIPKEGLTFLLACLAIKMMWGTWAQPLNPTLTPIRAVDFIKQEGLPTPLMNSFGQGGYVLYRHSDEKGDASPLVTIDGRTNLIKPEQWLNYTRAMNGTEGWEKYLESVKPETILLPRENPLNSILLAGREWCLVYRDGEAARGDAVFVKKAFFDGRAPKLSSVNCG